jgi:hypothetical protein
MLEAIVGCSSTQPGDDGRLHGAADWHTATDDGGTTMKYRVHRFEIRMTTDQSKLEQFLNSLEGEIVAIIPNVTLGVIWAHRVDFLLIVEKLA